MSCYRCGKTTPHGTVECDPPCDELPMDGTDDGGGRMLTIVISLAPDPAQLDTPEKIAEFQHALKNFLEGSVPFALLATGVGKFLKPIKP